MSLVKRIQNSTIDNLIRASSKEWIPYSEITDIQSSPIDAAVYNATRKQTLPSGKVDEKMIMLLCLGSDEICTPTLVSEFARIYSLTVHDSNDDVDHKFRRYTKWLEYRNELIKGFTEYDNNYYMVADKRFYHCYSRYGFCSECRILRCSPVWCI